MANATHKILRAQQAPRKARIVYENAGPGRRRAKVDTFGHLTLTLSQHRQGDQWWRNRRRKKPNKVIKGIE